MKRGHLVVCWGDWGPEVSQGRAHSGRDVGIALIGLAERQKWGTDERMRVGRLRDLPRFRVAAVGAHGGETALLLQEEAESWHRRLDPSSGHSCEPPTVAFSTFWSPCLLSCSLKIPSQQPKQSF